MRRVSSHYVYWNGFLRLYYVELDNHGCLAGVYPLTDEIAGTEFYDGILFPVVKVGTELHTSAKKITCLWNKHFTPIESTFDACRDLGLPRTAEVGEPVDLFLLSGLPLTATKFGTDDCGGDSYIQRL